LAPNLSDIAVNVDWITRQKLAIAIALYLKAIKTSLARISICVNSGPNKWISADRHVKSFNFNAVRIADNYLSIVSNTNWIGCNRNRIPVKLSIGGRPCLFSDPIQLELLTMLK